ncbi:MAG: dephospho-CoA kinase [Betaproteobacteria bacterium]|nr:dephospho-CoA kinase [Betaproteobacteria bacterium]
MTFIVGLTGGIGSGKSAAADAFEKLGAAVVDTDRIAHELTRAGGAAIVGVRALFGDSAIAPDGTMDRKAVRERVFSDPGARRRLEALLHPMIRAESERQIAAAAAPYVVHVVPLLVESPDHRERVQRVLVVDCPEALQIERVRARSGLSTAEVEAIIRSQVPREKRLAAADDVIDNSGAVAALQKKVQTLHQTYLVLARS